MKIHHPQGLLVIAESYFRAHFLSQIFDNYALQVFVDRINSVLVICSMNINVAQICLITLADTKFPTVWIQASLLNNYC